jgi:hypothetical protein
MPPKRVVRETVSLYEAKTQLSRLVVPGKGKGRWRVGKDFDAPLPDDLLEGFGGGP